MDHARTIIAGAEEEARKNGWAVAIAVVDDGGHLLAFQRMDNVAPIASYIAPNKARTSAMGIRESRIYEEMINTGRYAVLSVPHIEALMEGGVPVMIGEYCVGAVGISGVKSHEDAIIARAGIAALKKMIGEPV